MAKSCEECGATPRCLLFQLAGVVSCASCAAARAVAILDPASTLHARSGDVLAARRVLRWAANVMFHERIHVLRVAVEERRKLRLKQSAACCCQIEVA